MEGTAQPDLNAALNRLWTQFLPQMQERVAAMQSANEAFAAGTITTEQRAAANSAAHKLAGVLGTFGLTRGTVLAREAELLYSEDTELDDETVARLIEIAEHLRAMIATHN